MSRQVIVPSISELFDCLQQKAQEIRRVEDLLRQSPRFLNLLNHRQIALLNRALKKPGAVFYIESHRGAHNITYDTARTDITKLAHLGLLEKNKIGKAFVFTPVSDLRLQLEQLGS